MQRIIFDYSAKRVNVGSVAFATSYSDILKHREIVDNAVEISSGDITLGAVNSQSVFAATSSQYLQLISSSPFYIRTTIATVQSQVQKTGIFSYYNKSTPLDSIQLYNGSTIYDVGLNTFTANAGTKAQTVSYILLKF